MILSAMQSAAIRLLGRKPDVFFGASQTFELEICDLINEVAIDIAKYQDWQALTKIARVFSGTTEYTLPFDYDRQLLNSDVTRKGYGLLGYTQESDINVFLADPPLTMPGSWIIYDGKMRFSPTTVGEARFPYISNFLAKADNNNPKQSFTLDTDRFVLPERLLTLALVWRWRENKKLDATGDYEAFIKALDEEAAKDKGSRIIRRNGSRRWGNTVVPYMGIAV